MPSRQRFMVVFLFYVFAVATLLVFAQEHQLQLVSDSSDAIVETKSNEFIGSKSSKSTTVAPDQASALNKRANIMLEGMQLLDSEELSEPRKAPQPQDQVDAILKAFHHLPESERDRLGVDITKGITAGSAEADKLLAAWSTRQLELKQAMQSVMQPAEHMAELASVLTRETSSDQFSSSSEDKVSALLNLESLLSDVDNARDFHTIGAWPSLISMLLPNESQEVRMHAAWAIGSAVKNDYDYQLWTLETIPTTVIPGNLSNDKEHEDTSTAPQSNIVHRSCLSLLVDMIEPGQLQTIYNANSISTDFAVTHTDTSNATTASINHDMQKRALYALASSLRGNLDVQDAVAGDVILLYEDSVTTTTGDIDSTKSAIVVPRYLWYLHSLVTTDVFSVEDGSPVIPPQLMRKVWASISDLLEERTFIREELRRHLTNSSPATNERVTREERQNSSNVLSVPSTDVDNLGDSNLSTRNGDDGNHTSSTIAEEAVEAIERMNLLGDLLLFEPLHDVKILIPRRDSQFFKVSVNGDLADATVDNRYKKVRWPALAVKTAKQYLIMLEAALLSVDSTLSNDGGDSINNVATELKRIQQTELVSIHGALHSLLVVIRESASAVHSIGSNIPYAGIKEWQQDVQKLAVDVAEFSKLYINSAIKLENRSGDGISEESAEENINDGQYIVEYRFQDILDLAKQILLMCSHLK